MEASPLGPHVRRAIVFVQKKLSRRRRKIPRSGSTPIRRKLRRAILPERFCHFEEGLFPTQALP
jgi:hypothetical protein